MTRTGTATPATVTGTPAVRPAGTETDTARPPRLMSAAEPAEVAVTWNFGTDRSRAGYTRAANMAGAVPVVAAIGAIP